MTEQTASGAPRRTRRSLGPGLTALLVLDVVLVIALVAVFVGTRAADRDTPVASPTASVQPEESPGTAAPEEPETTESLSTFVLPSGNIHCSMSETEATCTILQYSYEAPALEGCEGTAGNVVTVAAGEEARWVCLDDDVPPVPADAPELDYGQGSTVGEMTCLSSENGVYCRHDTSGKGFSLARAGSTFF